VICVRNFLIIWIGVAAAYWIDQAYYGGAYSRPVGEMLYRIIIDYR
jgi:hypothetical protein